MYPNVAIAHERRYQALDNPLWVEAWVHLLRNQTHFRWFDSGDLQGEEHLEKIIEIARQLPYCTFWLPTQERVLVTKYVSKIPRNLIVRISQVKINHAPLKGKKLSSMVYTKGTKLPAYVTKCKSPEQGGQCKDCRDCFDPSKQCIAYLSHGRDLLTINRKGA